MLWAFSLLLLPAVGGLVVGAVVVYRARRAGRAAARALLVAVPLGVAAGVAYGVSYPSMVSRLTSSTAGLAFLALPLLATFVACAAVAPAWAAAVLWLAASRARSRGERPGPLALTSAVVILAVTALAALTLMSFERDDRLSRDPASSPDALRAAHADYLRWEPLYGVYAQFLLRFGNNHVLARVATHPNAPEGVVIDLTRHPNESVSSRAARSPSLTPEVLRRLASSGDPVNRRVAAMNARTPEDALRSLAGDPGLDGVLGWNPALPDDVAGPILTKLAAAANGPGSEYTRAALARHLRAPADFLRGMSGDPAAVVREAVAFNARTPVDVLERLSRDGEPSVRRGVGGNRTTPGEILQRLAEDPDPAVRSMVRANPGRPGPKGGGLR